MKKAMFADKIENGEQVVYAKAPLDLFVTCPFADCQAQHTVGDFEGKMKCEDSDEGRGCSRSFVVEFSLRNLI